MFNNVINSTRCLFLLLLILEVVHLEYSQYSTCGRSGLRFMSIYLAFSVPFHTTCILEVYCLKGNCTERISLCKSDT